MGSVKFSQKIGIIIGNPYVKPPGNVLDAIFKQAGKSKGPIPVKGKIDGAAFKQTLVKYQGFYRLYVNIIMANAAGIKFTKSISEIVGKEAIFEIEYDPDPPKFMMLSFLKKALDKNPEAKDSWEKLPPSRQKEILRYFSWLKSNEAKERNVKKVLAALTGEKVRFMARDWRGGK